LERGVSYASAFQSERRANEIRQTECKGTRKVDKIVESPSPSSPEKAEIRIEGADELYREIRINNTLRDKDGDEVRLKRGDEVEVTIEAHEDSTTPDGGRK
jgi:hypothetical protein